MEKLAGFSLRHGSMPRSRTVSCKNHRRHVGYPGLLEETTRLRAAEFRYPSFPPYALELICFDLRRRCPHWITLPFSRESQHVQDAFDRLLVQHYVPGAKARGLLVCAALCEEANAARSRPFGDFAAASDYVHYSDALAPCIEQRWNELGYAGFSAYVTGLIRYDLLLLGPHKYFDGDDWKSERMAELDAITVKEFHEAAGKLNLTYLERMVNQTARRNLTGAERDAVMKELVAMLREWALTPKK